MTEIRLTKEYMDKVIIDNGMIPLDFKVESCNQQIHYMDKDGYKYNYSWSQFKHRINKTPIQKISQSNIYSIENIKLYLKLNNITSELLSDTFTKVTDWNLEFSCSNCGKEFVCSWNKFKRRRYYFCDECLVSVSGVYKDKKDRNEVIENFKKIGLTVKNINEYVGSCVNIECFDDDGYKYSMRHANALCGKIPNITHKTNPFSIENLNTFLKNNGSNTICVSENYKDEKQQLKFICGGCGEYFYNNSANIKSSKHKMCSKCAFAQGGLISRIPLEKVIQRFEEMELKLLDYNYTRNCEKLLCEDKYGYRGYMDYNSKSKVDKSSRTGFDYFSLKHNKENFIYNANNYCKENGIGTKVISIADEQIFTTPTIICKCECGNDFTTSINSFRSGKTVCDICSKRDSRYERKVMDYFKKNKIKYTKQKKFKDCRNILPLPFDFYIKDLNLLIEADGQGHYQICNFNRCSKEQAMASFESTKKNDAIKNKYCEYNNIKLIRIPYWEIENENYIKILNQSILNLAD